MNKLQTIEEHSIIRETIGYEVISKIDLIDLPEILIFLKVVDNYNKMLIIKNKGN